MKMTLLIILAALLSGCANKPKNTPFVGPELSVIKLIPALKPPKIKIEEEKPIGEAIAEKPGIVHIKFKGIIGYTVGTGFFVIHNNNKYLLTAGHNIGLAKKMSVFRNSGAIKVNILKYKTASDADLVAFLVETAEPCFELEDPKIFDGIPDYGDLYKPGKYKTIKIDAYGYPSEWHFRKITGSIYQTVFGGKFLVSTGKCEGGMSGGPWFNKENNKIVAVHAVQLANSSGGVPVGKIIKLLDGFKGEKK